MTEEFLLETIGDAPNEYIWDAQKFRDRRPRRGSLRKRWLLAAVIALLALTATACAVVAYARIHMKLVQHNVPTAAVQTGEEIPSTARNVLTDCYPQQLPQGYAPGDGMPLDYASRNIYYRNDAGEFISFSISTAHDTKVALAPPVEKTSLKVSGWDATMQVSEKGAQVLVWHNESEGYYAGLFTQDMAVDLPAMAESVDFGETMPLSFLYHRGKQWDIWYPQQIPEGYQVWDVSPIANGTQSIEYSGGNSGGNIQYVISTERDLSDISDPPHDSFVWEELTVAGQPAKMMTTSSGLRLLFWKNEAEGFNAMLSVEDESVDILTMAESVAPGPALEISPTYLGPDYTIELEQDSETYVGWEPVYPQQVPDGYAVTFVSDTAYGQQNIDYENADGNTIYFTLYFRLGQWGRQFSGLGQPEQVDINGHTGYRIDAHHLVWVDEARGFGFSLCADADVDLLTVARSVAPGPVLTPTNADWTVKALEQLGDYQITALPDGMVEDGLIGAPLEEGGGWYSYVRRWYFDRKTNQDIYFEYESYVADRTSAEDVARMYVGEGDNLVQMVTVNDCPGAAFQTDDDASVIWIVGDGTKGVQFKLYSETYSAEELLKIAESVQKP